MFRSLFILLNFLFFLNLNSQNVKIVKLDSDILISDFLNKYEISTSDFFILNPEYSNTRFNHTVSDLNKVLIGGTSIKILENIQTEKDNSISFITHKIKKKQGLFEIAKIYDISDELILKYNKKVEIKKNNFLKIPINNQKNYKSQDYLKIYEVRPKEGKWRIAYRYGISVKFLEDINPDMGIVLKIAQKIVVPNKQEIELNNLEDDKEYFEIQRNIPIAVLEKNLGLKTNSIADLNPGILNNDSKKGIIIKVPSSTTVNDDVINISKRSLDQNMVDFDTRKFAIILPFRLENFDYDSINKSIPVLKNDKLLNISLDFLFGAEMAVSSYSELGIDVEMDVFDSALNKDAIDNILSRNNFDQYDFVIGPLTNNLFDYLVSKTERNNTKIVRAFSKKQNNNKRIINTIPNDSILFNKIISHVKKDSIPSSKYIISDSKSIDISDKIRQIFPDSKQFFSIIDDSGNDTKTLVYDDLDSTFVKGKNVVFLETKEQGFVSNVTSILNSFVNDTIEITLVSTNKNNAFEGVNVSNNFLSNLKFQYVSTNRKIDETKDDKFINKFINTYKYFPNKYAIRAYDLVYDLLLRLSNGNFDNPNVYETEAQYLENKFKYFKSSSGSLDNAGVFIMKYEDLKIQPLVAN
tara:strand:- start:13496 stop:15406 length:1911 start_codon:yes stop_codon:yes gene_type:complete